MNCHILSRVAARWSRGPWFVVGKLLAVFGLLTICGSAHGALITNGSFESDGDFDFAPDDWTTTGQLTNAPTTPLRSNIQTRLNTNYASQGLVGLQLNGGQVAPGGGIYQDFATVAGTTYLLTFDFGKDAAGTGNAGLTIFVRDSSGILGTSLLAPTPIVDSVSDGFSSYAYQFVALSAVSNLQFLDSTVGGNAYDGKLDNIAVTAIPEPCAFALAALFCLFGLLGMGQRSGQCIHR